MTLHRQLIIAISLLFIALFLGTWVINIQSTRAFLEEQLASHAQDTATSLGLSLSPHMKDNDLATMNTMVNSIFDRGYYKKIIVTNMDGAPLIEKQLPVRIENVPDWLVNWIPLQTPERASLIMSGWKQAATIRVSSHPGYAYIELWSSTTLMLGWFVTLTLLSIGITSIALRFLLKPLAAVEKQAEAISARKYDLQNTLPRTRELRSVVVAMNKMTDKVREMFETQASATERLRELAYVDPLTGLGNRRYFETQAQSYIGSAGVSQGALFLIRLEGLQTLNESRGFAVGDLFIKSTAMRLSEVMPADENLLLARLTGGDFAVLTKDVTDVQTEELATRITHQLAQLYPDGLAYVQNVVQAGVAMYKQGDDLRELLAQSDTALRSAQATAPNSWTRFQRTEHSSTQGLSRQEWTSRLKHAIEEKLFVLYAQQAIQLKNPQHLLHHEVLLRLPAEDGKLFTADKFMPFAAQLGVIKDIDYQVIEKVISHLSSKEPSSPIAINLSSAAMRDEAFIEKTLQSLRNCKTSLIFEVSEFIAVRELEHVKRFAVQLHALDHHIAVDHFGRAFSSFGYLQSLRPLYVKIDGAFTHNICDDRDKQFYIRSLCSVAHSLDIQTIVSGIEQPNQWPMLASLNIDGVQGYASGQIIPIEQIGQ